jgi:hypothetical protein
MSSGTWENTYDMAWGSQRNLRRRTADEHPQYMRRRERSIEDEYDEYAMDVPSRKRDFLYKVCLGA